MSAAAGIPVLRDERDLWAAEDMACAACGREWVAMRSLGTPDNTLECPSCGIRESMPLNEAPRRPERLH